jgi:hypothetical protein
MQCVCGRMIDEDHDEIAADSVATDAVVYRCCCGRLCVVEGGRVTWYVPEVQP